MSPHTSAGGVPGHPLAPGGLVGALRDLGVPGSAPGFPVPTWCCWHPRPQPGRSGANTGSLLLVGVFMCLCKRGKRTQSAMRKSISMISAHFPARGFRAAAALGTPARGAGRGVPARRVSPSLRRSLLPPGAELPAGLAVPEEVEDDHPGLHQVPPRRQHAQEEPGCLQHAGGRGRVCPAAPHPRQQLPAAAADGGQLQEASHHARRCQQHLPQQVSVISGSRSSAVPWQGWQPAGRCWQMTPCWAGAWIRCRVGMCRRGVWAD